MNATVPTFEDNTPLEQQVEVLADFLMEHFAWAIVCDGAIGTAMQILSDLVEHEGRLSLPMQWRMQRHQREQREAHEHVQRILAEVEQAT